MLFFLYISIAFIQAGATGPEPEKGSISSIYKIAGSSGVLINEIMFDPEPSRGLPSHEYIELWNRGPETVSLKNWKINQAVIPEFALSSGAYLILCKSGFEEEFIPFGRALGVSPWDILNNSGQEIRLYNASDILIDRVYYNPALIQEEGQKPDGRSLELVNPADQCTGMKNWKVSVHSSGGTPGAINSVYSEIPDRSLPRVLEHRWYSPDTLFIRFSKPVEFALDEPDRFFKFKPSPGIHQIDMEATDQSRIWILTADPIERGKPYDLDLSGLTDCLGNEMKDTVIQTGIGKEPSFLDLLITELLIDEIPSNGLPESEYIELFNASGQIIDLGLSVIITRTDTFPLPGWNLFPGQFRVLCPATRLNRFDGISPVTGMSPFPRLLNEGQILALFNRQHQLIFSLQYNQEWYGDLEKSGGGYSIEMIDPSNPCGDELNWRASEEPTGGTPGRTNSVNQSNPDHTGPGIRMVHLKDPYQVEVFLSEKIHPQSTNDLEILFPDRSQVKLWSFDSLFFDSFTLIVDEALQASTQYEITLRGLRDCVGNPMNAEGSRSTFYLPRKPAGNDLIINELLFNPRPGGVDWVEIYNQSSDYLDLSGIILCNISEEMPENPTSLDPLHPVLSPSDFLVITGDMNQLFADFPHSRPGAVSQVSSMPPLPDQFGNIAILAADHTILDQFNYFSSYHHDLIRNDEGVSLERISYSDSTNHPQNWQSAASTSGYGTPTLLNSAHVSNPRKEDLIHLQSALMSPNGDGVDDRLNIDYSLEKPGYMGSVEIYNIAGFRLCGILENRLLGTQGTISWDGYTEKGQIPYSGIYLVRFEIYNLQGDHRIFIRKFVISR